MPRSYKKLDSEKVPMAQYQVCFVRIDQAMIRYRAADKRYKRLPLSKMFTCLPASYIDEIIEEYINFEFVIPTFPLTAQAV